MIVHMSIMVSHFVQQLFPSAIKENIKAMPYEKNQPVTGGSQWANNAEIISMA